MKKKLLLSIHGLICLSCSTIQITSAMSPDTEENAPKSIAEKGYPLIWESAEYQAMKQTQLLLARKEAADIAECVAQMEMTIKAEMNAASDIALCLEEALSNLKIEKQRALAANKFVEWLETAALERAETIDPNGSPDRTATDKAAYAHYRALLEIESLLRASLEEATKVEQQEKAAQREQELKNLRLKIVEYHT